MEISEVPVLEGIPIMKEANAVLKGSDRWNEIVGMASPVDAGYAHQPVDLPC